MTSKIIFSKADINDIPVVIQLAESIWPFTYMEILTPEQISYMMQLFYSNASLTEQFSRDTFLIGYLDGEPVGFASYSVTANEEVYKLHKLYVKTALQGQGLGKAFLHAVSSDIQRSGGKALELNVNRNNKARMFYERLGFRVIREEDNDIGNGFWMNDYVMRLELLI